MSNKKTLWGYITNTILFALFFVGFFIYQNGQVMTNSMEFRMTLVPIIWQCCYFIILVTSLNMVLGFLGQLSLGHCGFMAIGAYATALISLACERSGIFETKESWTFILLIVGIILVSGLLAAIAGLLVGIPALRLKGDYLAIITLGFGMIIINIINNIPWCGGKGLSEGSAMSMLSGNGAYLNSKLKVSYDWIAIIFTFVCVMAIFMFIRSKYGRAIKAIRDDEIAAGASGLNVSKYKIMTFTYSAFFAGIAGGIYACTMSTLESSSFAFSNNSILNSVFIVVMVVVGGMGSLTGSIISAVFMFLLNYYIKNVIDTSAFPTFLQTIFEYPMLVYALALVLLMIFRPRGMLGTYEFSVVGTVEKIANSIKSKKAAKENKGGNE